MFGMMKLIFASNPSIIHYCLECELYMRLRNFVDWTLWGVDKYFLEVQPGYMEDEIKELLKKTNEFKKKYPKEKYEQWRATLVC